MDFAVGQVFFGEYPPESAEWCNDNRAFLQELEPVDGERRFRITAEASEEEWAAMKREALKQNMMTVESDGILFAADEEAQKRMIHTINAATSCGIDLSAPCLNWASADGTVLCVSVDRLKRILKAALVHQTDLWSSS